MSRDPSEPLRPGLRWLGALVLVAVVVLVYARSLAGEPVYDDLYLVLQNPDITSFENVPRFFTRAYWDFLDEESGAHVGYYRPLASVMLALGWMLGDGAPAGFHVVSILLHVLASLAAWLFAARLVDSERVGFFAALLFALHPLQVEGVAWISGVNVPLFGLFALLSLASWLRWRRAGSSGLPWVAGLLLIPALFAKEAAVAVVPMAFAIDLARGLAARRAGTACSDWRVHARAYVPFALAGLVWYGARVATFGDALAGFDRETTVFGVSAARLAMLRVELFGGALKLLAWPSELNLFRAFVPALEPTSRGFVEPLAWSLAALGAIAVLVRRAAQPLTALALLVPAALFPVLARVESLGTFPLSDRFLYLPVIGFTALVAWLAHRWLPRPAAVGALGAIAIVYSLSSFARIGDWRDEPALFERAVAQNPRNPSVHWGLGRVRLEQYRATGDPAKLAEAHASYDVAMDLLEAARTDETIFAAIDDYRQANLGLGWTLLFEAELDPFHAYEEARIVFERVTKSYPTYHMGFVGLGAANMALQKPDDAGVAFRRALELNPRSPEAHYYLGTLFLRLGEWTEAERHFRAAGELRTDHLSDMIGLARALQMQGRLDEATTLAHAARARFPQSAEPTYALGLMTLERGQSADALRWFDATLALSPEHGMAHRQRGMVLMSMHQFVPAAAALQRAAQLMPGDFTTFYNLGALLQLSENPRAAIAPLQRAYELRKDDELGKAVHQALIDLEVNDLEVLRHLGFVDAARGDIERADEWAERCLAIDPEHAPCQFLKGLVLKEREEFDAASAMLVSAAQGLPDNYQVRFETGALLVRLGRDEEALPHLRAALELLKNEPLPGEVKTSTGDLLQLEIRRITGE